ncbi:transmembrane sensor [Acidovorax soli]|uniref:Transmembrane sensor n=1 Tax=Acidovorax soli TaxID=592050 RepID=A0A7X0PJS2_9BURK|nr:FecR domain-containing protein [Acidovorax soli]MBB6563198.1 transmembrane sensor [Acidovorax soli]
MPPPTPRPPPVDETPSARLRDEALGWFVRQRNADFGAQEQQALAQWLAADPQHRSALAHWQNEWQAFSDIPPETVALLRANVDFDVAMQAASAQGAPAAATAPPQGIGTGVSRRRWLAPAAAACLVVAAGGVGWNHWRAQPVWTQSHATQRGQQLEVTLADATRIRLDTATRIEVRYYRDRREVRLLGGQALFTVQPDAAKPFHVQAGPARVTVVGTRFAVRHTPDIAGAEAVQVAVEEGRVRLQASATPASGPGAGAMVELTAGQQATASADGQLSAATAVSAAGVAPWTGQRVRFDDIRLDRALAELGRYRDTRLVVRDPAVAALRITGVFDPADMATFRRLLPLSLPVQVREADGGVAEIVARPSGR